MEAKKKMSFFNELIIDLNDETFFSSDIYGRTRENPNQNTSSPCRPCNDSLDKSILEQIYIRYNDNLSDDYHGRSISPSDIIELYDNEKNQYFYCDSVGFTKVKFSPELAFPMKVQAQ